mmetsp:Transcript_107131/g.341956  ORF Transcript_107131/g.341956 Transcript_107131/m.341956 type:complete len:221 (+) Transcript_107131:485-1147(+)
MLEVARLPWASACQVDVKQGVIATLQKVIQGGAVAPVVAEREEVWAGAAHHVLHDIDDDALRNNRGEQGEQHRGVRSTPRDPLEVLQQTAHARGQNERQKYQQLLAHLVRHQWVRDIGVALDEEAIKRRDLRQLQDDQHHAGHLGGDLVGEGELHLVVQHGRRGRSLRLIGWPHHLERLPLASRHPGGWRRGRRSRAARSGVVGAFTAQRRLGWLGWARR